jgi:hypothetical protein
LVLDYGDTFQLSAAALLPFWGSVLIILLLRRRRPTRFDLWYVRWGYLPIVFVMQVAARSARRW